MTISDEQIKKNIIDQLYWDSRVDASNIHVFVEDGSVVLKGTVPTFAIKKAACFDAHFVPGVRSMDDQIKVNDSEKILED